MADRDQVMQGWIALFALLFLVVVTACQRSAEETPVPSPSANAEVVPGPTTTLPPVVISLESAGYPAPLSGTPTPTNNPKSTPANPVQDPYPAPDGYPEPPSASPTRSPVPALSATAGPTAVAHSYLPLVPNPPATPTPTPTFTPQPSPTPTPTIDFAAVRAELQSQGQDLGFVKIGFHTAVGGNRTGLGEWMRRLDEAGVPFFLKSADDSGPLVDAQKIVRTSSTPHTLVFRRSGDNYDTPDYDLPPLEAAQQHWQLHREAFPGELDPNLVWLETINEVDKGRSEWLAQFSLETARLALADGFRWAAFGWSSGEPEVVDWQSPAMLEFLRLVAANPDRLAIAVHEYSFRTDDIADEYPFKVGRFQQLFQVADQHGIPRPTLLITEWGWEYQAVPSVGEAIDDIEWAAALYAPYPEIKGAAIWFLGGGFGNIAEEVQKLIRPVTDYSLGNYFIAPLPPSRAPINPELHRP